MKKKIYIILILMSVFVITTVSLSGQVPADTKESAVNDPDISASLLPVDDKDLKYSRIDGIKLKKTSSIENTDIVNIPENKAGSNIDILKETGEDKKEVKKGLFGFTSDKTDLLAKGGIALLIFIIFILYRVRSRNSGSRIMRNYSKK